MPLTKITGGEFDSTQGGLSVAGIITATGGFIGTVTGNTTGSHIGNVTAGSITINAANNTISGISTAGITTVYISAINDGPISGTRNRIINGDMRIDQRNAGASVSVNSASSPYCPDRFQARIEQATAGMTAQQSTTVPAGFINSLLMTVTNTTAPAAGNRVHTRQIIEGFNVADLGWGSASAQTVTLSFWVRSSVTGTYGVGFINSAENRSYVGTYIVNTANTFEYKTITLPGDTSGTWITNNGNGIRLTFDLGSGTSFNATANAWVAQEACRTSGCVNFQQNSGATFYLTGVQLEPGTVVTPFERRSYGQELALCQRYFFKINGNIFCMSYNSASGINNELYGFTSFPVPMRSSPTVSATAPLKIDNPGVANYTQSSVNILVNVANNNQSAVFTLANFTGLPYGTMFPLRTDGGTILLSAEL